MTPTEGTLLGGRVAYRQWREGYRTGFEPVLLAACVPARAGDRIVEGGCGAGAGLLCLAARVVGITGLGVEIDRPLASLAAENLAANDFANCIVEPGDLTQWRAAAPFDHAFANPPWHDSAGTASPDPARQRAKAAPPGALSAWARALSQALRPRATLSLILPAASASLGAAALREAGCGEVAFFPIWPRAGQPARLLVLRGVKSGRGPDRLLPGLVLHEADGSNTEAAEAVLRRGAALAL